MNEKNQTTSFAGKADSSGTANRRYDNPRTTGAVAAALLLTTLAAAIIPSSLSVRAEEQTQTAALVPSMQSAKEYIYAGSRMLAIEDYGLSGGLATPTPTITPTPTEMPTPSPTESPTPSPTVTPTPDPMQVHTEQMAQEIAGVLWLSEQDHPISTVTYEGDPLQLLASEYPGMTISESSFADVYARYGTRSESPDERDRKISNVINMIDGAANQAKVIRIGEIDMVLIIIGEWSSGRWFGIKTRVIET